MSAQTVSEQPSIADLGSLLQALSRDSNEKISVNYMSLGVFQSRLTTVGAAVEAARPHQDGDLWFATQVLHDRVCKGRGKAEDVVGLRDLNCDLDVKPGGMPTWEAAWAVIKDLSELLGVWPVAVVYSGHGLQPHWSVERDGDTDWPDEIDPRWADAVALWRRWGRLVAAVAARRDGAVDGVFDLSRVMRAPGSVNRKVPAEPVSVRTKFLSGAPVSLNRLREVCDESGVVEHPEDREVLGEVVQPASVWSFGSETCRYVASMVIGWAQDRPEARHPWLVSQSVRLAAARRIGCVSESDHAQAVEALCVRFRALLGQGVVRAEAPQEISSALDWGVRRVEAMTDDRARQELGSTDRPHVHATSASQTFWQERPVLTHIEQFARARMTSPWAVFGVVLGRVLATVPPFVVLPPLVGGKASLNTFVALVGPSGSGKGAAEAAGADAVDVGDVDVQTAGSGEGLVKLFGHREAAEVVRDRASVLLSVPEVDNLMALKARMGATIMPLLRSGWSGEKLGFSYADATKAVQIEPHTYRLCMLLGVQPGRAQPLLDDASGGTPQRFLWLPSTDPEAPDVPPTTPPPIHLSAQEWVPAGDGWLHLPVAPTAQREVQANRLAALRGERQPLDGHALLARLKVAQGLALLDGRRAMTDNDWRLSGVVMQVSYETRSAVVQLLADEAAQANLQRGKADGVRAAVADEVKDEHAIRRICKNIIDKLQDRSDLASSDLRRSLANRDRGLFQEALGRLEAAGTIKVTPLENGFKVRLDETRK